MRTLASFPDLSQLQVIKHWSRGRAGNETNMHLAMDSLSLLVRMVMCGYKVYESTDLKLCSVGVVAYSMKVWPLYNYKTYKTLNM